MWYGNRHVTVTVVSCSQWEEAQCWNTWDKALRRWGAAWRWPPILHRFHSFQVGKKKHVLQLGITNDHQSAPPDKTYLFCSSLQDSIRLRSRKDPSTSDNQHSAPLKVQRWRFSNIVTVFEYSSPNGRDKAFRRTCRSQSCKLLDVDLDFLKCYLECSVLFAYFSSTFHCTFFFYLSENII